jgi:hypothetical protein
LPGLDYPRYWVEVDGTRSKGEPYALWRAIGLFANGEIWEGGDVWRETVTTVPQMDGAGGTTDHRIISNPDETVDRLKQLLVGRAERLTGGDVTGLLYLDNPRILRDVYGVDPPPSD